MMQTTTQASPQSTTKSMTGSTAKSTAQPVPLNTDKAPAQESGSASTESNLEQQKRLDFKEAYEAAKNKKSEHQQQVMQEQSVKRAWQDKAEEQRNERQKSDTEVEINVQDDASQTTAMTPAIEQDNEQTEEAVDDKSTVGDILAQIQAAQQQVKPKQQDFDSDSDVASTAAAFYQFEHSKSQQADVENKPIKEPLTTSLNPISQLLTELADKSAQDNGSHAEDASNESLANPLTSLLQLTPKQPEQSTTATVSPSERDVTKVIAIEQPNVTMGEVSNDDFASENEAPQQTYRDKVVQTQSHVVGLTQDAQDKSKASKEKGESTINVPSFNKGGLEVDNAKVNTAVETEPESTLTARQVTHSITNTADEAVSSSTNKDAKVLVNAAEKPQKTTSLNQLEPGTSALEKIEHESILPSDAEKMAKSKVTAKPESVSQANVERSTTQTNSESMAVETNKLAKPMLGDVGQTLATPSKIDQQVANKLDQLSASDIDQELGQTRSKITGEVGSDSIASNKETLLGEKIDTRAVLKQQGKELAAQAEQQETNARETLVKEQIQTAKGQGINREAVTPSPSMVAAAPQQFLPSGQIQSPPSSGQLGQPNVTSSMLNAAGISQTQGASGTTLSAFEMSQKFELAAKEAPSVLRERITMMVNKGITQAEIKLDPAELGSMHVKLSMQNDQLSINVQTTQAQSKELVEQHMPRLRELLSQQGINLGESHVGQQQSGSKEMSQSQQQGRGSGQAEQHLATTNEVELMPMQNYVQSNSAIDYYA